MSRYWPNPEKIRSTLRGLGLESAKLFFSPYSVTYDLPPRLDPTTVHVSVDGEVVAVLDPATLDGPAGQDRLDVDEVLPSSDEPRLRIPFEDLDHEPDPEALPDDRWIDTAPFFDSYLQVEVAQTEPPDDLVWKRRDEIDAE